ncbi:hypothetical protein H0264_00060 [Nocardia huaxiensis]|uniref:DUF732 domain-containing protein n=1 Tax=Nocardia huaxiensis TaxID=2755382 RepID=A0A7D6VIK5_9NOCA|nr:hypothetical protein [Nocardia huaxiensis]QLY30856.1 hypothetical protein H0264_00060 [Nocardia huaxiensis]
MRKTLIAAALAMLPLLAACGSSDQSTAPSTSAAAATSVAATTTAGTTSAAPTTTVKTGTSTTTVSGAPLTAAEISKALQDKGSLDAKTANCIAEIYIDEGISQPGLRKILESDSTTGTLNVSDLGLTTSDIPKAVKATARVVSECN